MKPTICHLTSVHPAFDIRIFHKECRSLAHYGFNVFLIAPINQTLQIDGIKIIPVSLPKKRLIRMLKVPFILWKKALKIKAEIYHFHDPELMFCGVLLKLSGKKVIFDIHENVRLSFQSKDWLPKWFRKPLSSVYYLVEKGCLPFFDHLILAEESYANYYPKRKSTVVLNFPLPYSDEIPKKEYTLPVRFVYSGVVHPLRGIWEMLDLIYRLNQSGIPSTLDLIGEVRPEKIKNDIYNYLLKHHLESQVKVHGKVEFNEVSKFLQRAHIGLALLKPIPNYKESLPTKIFEYMQHQLPVITNNFELYKKYVEIPGSGICVDIEAPEILFEKVRNLIETPENIYLMGICGWNLVNTNITWESQEQILLSVYKKLKIPKT